MVKLRQAVEGEFDYYVDAFIQSSNRVRYAIVTVTIASVLLAFGHHNASDGSWFNSRLALANRALHEKVWEIEGSMDDLPEDVRLAKEWADGRGLRSEAQVMEHIKTLEEARTDRLILLQIPFFGVSHDVNDLGLLGGVALTILMLLLTFAMARQNENLYLSLWRIRRAFEDDERAGVKPGDRRGRANLIYHTLAMSQQFSQPPTLARWRLGKMALLSPLLLLAPFVIQMFCYIHDLSTVQKGMIINSEATIQSLVVQSASLVLVLMMTLVCLAYSHANNVRWRATFQRINPAHVSFDQPSWLEWVKLRAPKEEYCELPEEEEHEERARDEFPDHPITPPTNGGGSPGGEAVVTRPAVTEASAPSNIEEDEPP